MSSIFDRARASVSIADLVTRSGVKLVKQGERQRAMSCPLCGAGGKSRSMPFVIGPGGDSWSTWCCGKRGDVVDFERELGGGTPAEAAYRLIGPGGQAVEGRAKVKVERPSGPSAAAVIGAAMWAESRPIGGTLGERYLRHRGILDVVIEAAAGGLRYHGLAKAAWDEAAGGWVRAPAILVRPTTVEGDTGGIHATYLLRDATGRDKRLGKKMWGPQALETADGRRLAGGAWLIGPEGDGDLAVGEGVETVLSMVSLAILKGGRPMRACAALSLGRLEGGVLTDADGLQDAFDPRPDPERPPFVWPARPDERAGVWIGLDRDMSPVRVRGRTGRGKPCQFQLDGEARARRCGRLAARWWADAGWRARAIAPPPGMDFNDELVRVRQSGAGEGVVSA